MRKIVFLLLMAFVSVNYMTAQDNSEASKRVPEAKFDTLVYNYGKVKESDKPVKCTFEVENVGTAPLIIQRVSASCGCTTPEYTKDPILPGEKGKIDVSYDTKGRVGPINKTITVFTNVPDKVYKLKITGEVIRAKE